MSNMLDQKKVLLAITGGIAAYKSAELCRELKKSGAEVRVVMTSGAQEFITPLTLQALSGNPVHTDLLDPAAELGMGHIELAKWPDLIIVAPATANLIAKYAQGLADDLLTTVLLATQSSVFIAPAMNQAMWSNPLTQRNVDSLAKVFSEQIVFIGPESGDQACGDVGEGRMSEPRDIIAQIDKVLTKRAGSLGGVLVENKTDQQALLLGKKVAITAGPTREALDPVRYISNHSSGKMGYALAEQFSLLGADVVLVSGPCHISVPENVRSIPVESAKDMKNAVMNELALGVDIFVACAAVADYAPADVSKNKLKKKDVEGEELVIRLRQNPDIVAEVASSDNRPFTVGFAAETTNVLDYARGKLEKKNLDMIVANDVSNSSIGFNSDHNAVHIITKESEIEVPQDVKSSVAQTIVLEVCQAYLNA